MITQDIIKQFEDKFSDMLYKAKESAWHAASDMPLSRALTPFITASPFSEVECDLFQNKLRYFAGYLGADYTLLSARNFDMEEVWPGDHCFLEDGYASIIKYLSKNCSVQLNTIVSNITLQNRHVEITTNQGKYTADAVIVTLPLGVLKSNAVTFDPPLPKHKQDAINRMGMGLLNVNAFKFTKMFWPNHLQAMHFAQFDETSIASFFNLHYFMDEPILLGYIGGERAKALEDYDDARILQKVMDNFKIVFGPHLIETEAYFIGRFGTCPFSRGAYSYPAVGSGPVDYETLSEPINNQLFFAGEATSSKYFATTHGAYLSGIREANRIIQQTTLG